MSSSSIMVAKTPHRRRRKIKVNPSAPEKENSVSNVNASAVKKPPTKQALEDALDDRDVVFATGDQSGEGSSSSSSSSSEDERIISQALRTFQETVPITNSSAAVSLFQDDTRLAESVVRVSLFPTQTAGLWYVEEHASALLIHARKMIQQATNQSSSSSQKDSLLVAVHCLRTVLVTLQNETSPTQVETCIRLLYHLIATASASHIKEPLLYEFGFLVISGFEALRSALASYSIRVSNGRTLHFLHHISSDSDLTRIALPAWSSNTATPVGSMTLRQLATIALKSSLALALALHQLWWYEQKDKSAKRMNASISMSIVAMYGRLTHHLVQQQQRSKSTRLHPQHCLLDLFQEGYRPWLSFIADSEDEEASKDLLAHCKSGHKLLWDAASKLKGAASSLPSCLQGEIMEAHCLALRGQAVALLLPEAQTTAGRSLIGSTHWDAACTYAWKAATVYEQQIRASLPVDLDSPLAKFHSRLGSQLDQWRSSSSSSSRKLPVAYVEYCTYRASHCGIGPDLHECGYGSCCEVDLKGVKDSNDNSSVILAAILLSIRAKHGLVVDGCDGITCISSLGSDAYLEELIHNFDDCVLAMARHSSTLDTQNRYFKLVSMLSLHRTIFEALKDKNWVGKEVHVEIIAILLSRCFGPLTLSMLSKCTDQSKLPALYDAAAECYIRPLAAFERLSESSSIEMERERYQGMANDTIRQMYLAFCGDRERGGATPILSVEKCAKSIALVARQRIDHSLVIASLVPSLYSLVLYRYLSENGGTSDYQLSARLAHLANAFQESDKVAKSMVVLANVIAQELPSCYSPGCDEKECSGWSDIDLMHFLASRSKQVFSPIVSKHEPSSLARSSIRRLITLSMQSGCSTASNHDEALVVAWTVFTDNRDDGGANIATLLSHALHRQQSLSSTSHDYATKGLLLLVDAMSDLGESLRRTSTVESSQIDEYCALVQRVQEYAGASLFQSHSIQAAIEVVAATSLLPQKALALTTNIRIEEDDDIRNVLDLAIEFASNAFKRLESRQEILLTTTVFQFCCHLESCLGLDKSLDVFKMYKLVVDAVQNLRPAACVELREFSRRALLWNLSHFQSQLESSGDSVRAAIAALWILDCLDEDDVYENGWFQAAAMTTFRSNSLMVGIDRFENSVVEEELDGAFSMEWLSQAELYLSIVRAKRLLPTTVLDGSYSNGRIDSIRTQIEEANIPTKILEIFSQWVLSTTGLTSGELAAFSGNFSGALVCLQESATCCKAVISMCRRIGLNEGDTSLWGSIARSTLLSRAEQRYTEILCLRARLYTRLGDHRKAGAYLATLADFLEIEFEHIEREQGPDLKALYSESSILKEAKFRRLTSEIRCSTSPLDQIVSNLRRSESSWPTTMLVESEGASEQVEAVLNLISFGDTLYGESVPSPFQGAFPDFYEHATSWYMDHLSSNELLNGFGKQLGTVATSISSKVAVRRMRCLMQLDESPVTKAHSEVRHLSNQVIHSASADPVDRSWAHYYAAALSIQSLCESGGLNRLWDEEFNELSKDEQIWIESARDHLAEALSSCALGSSILSRVILRSLALVSGPELGQIHSFSSGVLVLSSIGGSYRQLMIRSLTGISSTKSNLFKDLLDGFEAFDSGFLGGVAHDQAIRRFFDSLANIVPSNWKFVAATICPSGDLLVTSIEKDVSDERLLLSTHYVASQDNRSGYENIMVPLDEIVRESQRQLSGMDVSGVSERFNKESAKRKWWEERYQLDEDLQSLVQQVESTYFPTLHLRGESSKSIFDCNDEDSNDAPIGNLASRFEAAVDEGGAIKNGDDADALRRLTVPTLKDRLRDEHAVPTAALRKMKKQELIDLLLANTRNQKDGSEVSPSGDGCLFLILDENLHRFPFEGMPSLAGRSVCRVPSLSFVLASFLERGLTVGQYPSVDPGNTAYVLDPEGNLLATRKRLEPVLDDIASEHGCDWAAEIGRVPPSSFFEEHLKREGGLVLYFGHGGAQTCFSRRQVDALISQPRENNHRDIRACKATVVLMGCSSGRLVSVNRKRSQVLEQIPLYYEPEGIALSYLCAGAPCVVGNLWDVTDHDIDRFSTTLLEKFLSAPNNTMSEEGGESLASCVATSRSACKLRYIVGCAPVCYGVPVHLLKKG